MDEPGEPCIIVDIMGQTLFTDYISAAKRCKLMNEEEAKKRR